ncbi:MAG: site-specific DNA-methyltransferase [Candidatus Roizmanbacteria bacterium]
MNPVDDTKLEPTSHDIFEQNREKIQELFPSCIVEGKINFEILKKLLGDEEALSKEEKERYGLYWPGKNDLIRLIQQSSNATLEPDREQSVNFDTSENIYIEGENLEVLKLLQRSYSGKIKMIYIDPPYNTGKDFVYPDDFKEPLQNYFALTGQLDQEGKKTSTNSETEGRYHTNWLNMMYPRLFLARNLLKDDGVIFISIDDKEVSNLRKICDEIFGELNRLATLVWDRNHSAQAGIFKVYHEYVLVYAKNAVEVSVPKSVTDELFEAGAQKRESSRHPMQEFTFPIGTECRIEDGDIGSEWGDIEKTILIDGEINCKDGKLVSPLTLKAAWTQLNQMKTYFYGDRENLVDSRGQKIVKFYLNSTGKLKVIKKRGVITPPTVLPSYGGQGPISTSNANLFNLSEAPLNNPKSEDMIYDFLSWFDENDSIVLDFFSGSATSAHAVLKRNSEDMLKRKYILVQIPETTDENKEAYKAGYKTIADIGRERIRRAAKKIAGEIGPEKTKQLDLGFKAFKLVPSNFKTWNGNRKDFTAEQLQLQVSHISEKASEESILYEILVKAGIQLDVVVTHKDIEGKKVYVIESQGIVLCLEKTVTMNVIKGIAELNPFRVICLDNCFIGNDQLKTNAVQFFKGKNIEFKSV